MIKILISARDPASANDIVPIFLALIKDKRFFVKILAQNPAHDIFMEKIPNLNIGQLVKCETHHQKDEFYSNIAALFDEFDPDCVLTGISGPENYGIDEILLNIGGRRKKVKTFSVQSYWGDINNSLGVIADIVFVLDSFAEEVTLKRCQNCRTVIVGSLSDNSYINIEEVRKKIREKYLKGRKKNLKVVGLFGQPLFKYKWYQDTILDFIKSMSKVKDSLIVVYRPHPKDDKKSTDWVISNLKAHSLDCLLAKDDDILTILSGTDMAVSLFSTVGYDLQKLLSKAKYPFSLPVYLFYNSKFKLWFKKFCKLDEIPMSGEKMSVVVNKKSDLNNIRWLFNKKLKEKSHIQCKKMLNHQSNYGARHVVSKIMENFLDD